GARVPAVALGHRSDRGHRGPVGAHACQDSGLALWPLEAAIASANRDAGGKPLDVPLERAGQRLVEVVDVEDELAVRGLEDTEVREVCVTAELDAQARIGTRGQVGGHDRGGAPVEGEGGGEHAPV